MAFKIGFAAEHPENKPAEVTYTAQQMQASPRKSVVQVYFAGRNMTLDYYNDRFDLHRGDIVYVDGILDVEGFDTALAALVSFASLASSFAFAWSSSAFPLASFCFAASSPASRRAE